MKTRFTFIVSGPYINASKAIRTEEHYPLDNIPKLMDRAKRYISKGYVKAHRKDMTFELIQIERDC